MKKKKKDYSSKLYQGHFYPLPKSPCRGERFKFVKRINANKYTFPKYTFFLQF